MATTLYHGGGDRPERDFHGAAIIGADGREIPITEAMVERALHALQRQWDDVKRRGERR